MVVNVTQKYNNRIKKQKKHFKKKELWNEEFFYIDICFNSIVLYNTQLYLWIALTNTCKYLGLHPDIDFVTKLRQYIYTINYKPNKFLCRIVNLEEVYHA